MKSVSPSTVDGTIGAPPSKSMAQRAVAAALLAEGVTEIVNPSSCDDALATMRMAEALGAKITPDRGRLSVAGGLAPTVDRLDAGESGLGLRLFSALCALCDREMTLVAGGTLRGRPVGMVEEPLADLGVRVRTNGGYPPVTICGPLAGGAAQVDGSVSSQFLSGLLMALPLAARDSTLTVPTLKSVPYVRMTIDLVARFGVIVRVDPPEGRYLIEGGQRYRPARVTIEGDWSGAAAMLVAGALAGRVTVRGLRADSAQGDKAIIDACRAAGARAATANDEVTVERGELRAFSFDATECPDLFPPLVALAAHCRGTTAITGAARLAHKESDRAATLAEEFGRLGVAVRLAGDRIEVDGGGVDGGTADARGDHRIAMALACAATAARAPVRINGWRCVSKSYPAFFEDLASLGARVE